MATYGIHRQLVMEGFNTESDDYYNEIDARLNARFNDNSNITTNSSNRPAQTVAGAARNGSATGRNTGDSRQHKYKLLKNWACH